MAGDNQSDARLRRLVVAKRERDAPYLLESLRVDPEHTLLTAKWLSEWGDLDAIPELVRLLSSERSDQRFAAISGLIRLGPPADAQERLVEMAVNDSHPNTRSWACVALGKYRDRALLPLLVSLLKDDDYGVRAGAAQAIGEIGDPDAVEPLRVALRDLRRKPLRWYLSRLAYKRAIKTLTAPS